MSSEKSTTSKRAEQLARLKQLEGRRVSATDALDSFSLLRGMEF